MILVVDEEPDDRLRVTQCFSTDYRVIAVQSGREALDFLETNEVDVILSVLSINDMSGLELFKQSRVSQPEAIRVLVTDYEDIENLRREIIESAVYQVIRKPWHPTALLLLVRRALESRDSRIKIAS